MSPAAQSIVPSTHVRANIRKRCTSTILAALVVFFCACLADALGGTACSAELAEYKARIRQLELIIARTCAQLSARSSEPSPHAGAPLARGADGRRCTLPPVLPARFVGFEQADSPRPMQWHVRACAWWSRRAVQAPQRLLRRPAARSSRSRQVTSPHARGRLCGGMGAAWWCCPLRFRMGLSVRCRLGSRILVTVNGRIRPLAVDGPATGSVARADGGVGLRYLGVLQGTEGPRRSCRAWPDGRLHGGCYMSLGCATSVARCVCARCPSRVLWCPLHGARYVRYVSCYILHSARYMLCVASVPARSPTSTAACAAFVCLQRQHWAPTPAGFSRPPTSLVRP